MFLVAGDAAAGWISRNRRRKHAARRRTWRRRFRSAIGTVFLLQLLAEISLLDQSVPFLGYFLYQKGKGKVLGYD